MITRLVLVVFIITSHIKSAAVNTPSPSPVDRIYITDYDGYRKINYKDQQLLVYSKENYKALFFVSNQFSQSYIEAENHKKRTFQIDSKNKRHLIVLNNQLISYYNVNKSKYHFDCADTIFNEITSADFEETIGKIRENNYNDILAANCTKNENFQKIFNKILAQEKFNIEECHESLENYISPNKILDKDYKEYLGHFYNEYYKFARDLDEGKKPLAIRCESISEGVLGSLDETTTPKTMTFDVDQIQKKTKDSSDTEQKQLEAFSEILRHELFHNGQPPAKTKMPEVDKCINEAMTTLFSGTCKINNINNAKKNNLGTNAKLINIQQIPSSDIKTACEKNPNIKLNIKEDGTIVFSSTIASSTEISKVEFNSDNLGKNTLIGPGQATMQQEAQNKQASQQLVAQTEKNLQGSISENDFIPKASDFVAKYNVEKKLTAGTTLGKTYSISPTSEAGHEIINTINTAETNGANTGLKLNAATTAAASLVGATIVGSKAVAGTTKEVTSTNTNSRSPASATPTTTANSKLATNTSANSLATAESTTTGAASGLQVVENTATGTTTATAGTTATTGTSTTTANTPAVEGTVAAATGLNQNQPNRQPSSNTQPQQNPTANAPQNTITIGTVRALENFTSISGTTYQTLSDYYRGDQQKQENLRKILSQNSIKIKYTDKNGKQQEIGASNPKKVFNDTGKGLVSIENKP